MDKRKYSSGAEKRKRRSADEIGIALALPRLCRRQTHRANTIGGDFESYYRTSIYVPYLDSLVSSLESRFSSNNSAQFNLFYLHPKMMQELQREEYRNRIAVSNELYQIDNFEYEMMNWFNYWHTKEDITKTLDLADLLQQRGFFPAVGRNVTELANSSDSADFTNHYL